MAHSRWSAAKRNFKSYKRQFQEKSPTERSYAKLKVDDVFDLLDAASSSAKSKVPELRLLMEEHKWEIAATVHAGGRGGDQELHFNIRFPKRHYHVRCKPLKDDTVIVFDITNR